MASRYNASQPRILIFGAGAVGTCYMYILQQAGCQVAAVCRSNYKTAKNEGFRLDSEVFGSGLHFRPVQVLHSGSEFRHHVFDFILVATKAFPQTSPSTAELISPFVTPDVTSIALLQNGIGIEDEYAALYPDNPILSCVVHLHATRTAATRVNMSAGENLEIGPLIVGEGSGRHEQGIRRADILCSLLRRGGGTASVYHQIQQRRWLKLLVNATWSPICALTQLDDTSFLKSSSLARNCVQKAMTEVIDVAQALGYVEVTQSEADHRIQQVLERVDYTGYEPSMAADVRHGRPMEIEAILGNTINIAREHNVPVPQLEVLYALLSGLDEALQMRNLEEL